MSFEKGKIAFQLFFIVLFQLTKSICQLNLYNTDQTFKTNSLQFDCLNYHVYREKLAYQELSDIVDELIPYCFRPTDNFDKSSEAFVDPLSQKLSFEEIRMANITSQQLLSWSIPIEVVERYQFYLNEPNSALNEHFYNCTGQRFGLRCQYSFVLEKEMSFNQIVEASFGGRIGYYESSNMTVQIPCYVLLNCHRDGQVWCLDWREVCDGKVDCFDEGADEESCFDMEINECGEDEYRCHNGLCISQNLWEDGVGDTDCLDRSDRAINFSYINSCFQDPTFRCEEHCCRAKVNPFSCGDGQCVGKFGECHNGRHILLIDSMTAKGNLTAGCWIAMSCLTRLIKKGDEKLCEILLMNKSTVYTALKQCDSFFQFPTIPVYSDHIRFFYKDPHLRSNESGLLLPDYVCYDEKLCDFKISSFVHENLTCLEKPKQILILGFTKNPWTELMLTTEQYFHSCSTSHAIFHNKTKHNDYSPLYRCQNSSKFISKHRIMDMMQDCIGLDDENYQNSCRLNDPYRVKCHDATKCWSPLVKYEACALDNMGYLGEIPFQSFCDGIDNYFYDDNRQKHTDEAGCENGLCNNMYTRCDGYLACSDGKDEDNCNRTICPSGTYACIYPGNYTVICLNFTRVNDKTKDCIGALDEQRQCRSSYPWGEFSYRFRCSNGDQCLQVSQLCNNEKDCSPGGDDEFCGKQQITYNQSFTFNRSEVEEVLRGLHEDENRRIKYFSVYTSSNYPLLEKNTVAEFIHWPTERHRIKNVIISQVENNLWPWHCNRGIMAHISIKNNTSNRSCMCPPSYYGHLCQYQNQRISLTLRLSSNDRHATYAIISMLIDDDNERQEINAYDQFVYIVQQSCSVKLNRYLLFSSRPKYVSKNYSVRIDIFEKDTITYVGSWHFSIAFLFLPVNRLSISLDLSNHQLQHSANCSITCQHGECVKYINKNKYFCRCSPKWSGIQCNIPINCQACSSNSICIGSTNKQSICVCPIDTFGPRCLLTSSCPINVCQNNGQCIPGDVSIPENNYTCICSDRFFGQNCEHRKAELDVSLNEMYIPLYIVAYFFTLSNKSEPIETSVLRKLTLFQHSVIFHIAVPFQLAFIQANDKYYLAALQESPKESITTSISPKQECKTVEEINSTVSNMFQYQRIIYFYYFCQTNFKLICFVDKNYLCLCTNDHHANCIKFNGENNFQCPSNTYCENGGKCLQDNPTCPSTQICLCPSCFFGNRCQFYAKGLGSTLDEILGYEIKRNTLLSKQPVTVKVGVGITMLIFLIGIINSFVSIIVFSRKKPQDVGCGIYLLASSITSLIIMSLLTLKFGFLFYSYQDGNGQQRIIQVNCFGIEPLLKVSLYIDSWLNACVAVERAMSILQGINFNKNRSRQIARWITLLLVLFVPSLLIPQFIHLHIFNDEFEERSWCVVKHIPWLQTYSSILIFFHYFAPLSINIFSAIFIIVSSALQRARAQTNHSLWAHLKSKLKEHKHILISSGIIICLTLPYLIISIKLDCKKSSDLFWFYLIGYFLSFFPATFVFIIFVLPSSFYRNELTQIGTYIRRRYEIFRLNRSRL